MNDNKADDRNSILQKAIEMYVAAKSSDMDYLEARTMLMPHTKDTDAGNGGDSDDDEKDKSTSLVTQLKNLKITTLPPVGEMYVRLTPTLEYASNEHTQKQGGSSGSGSTPSQKKTVTTTHFFRSSAVNAEEEVSKFVNDAYEWYLNWMTENEEKGRFMYNPIPKSIGHWKRYKLSGEKTFKCIFFPQKERLLETLEKFKEKKGKFSIEGYPHKLGLLLYGPPGTGKTSLIKALAQHTGRNIVNIPLSRIKTNQQLTDLVFDQSFSCPGLDSPVKLEFKDTIFCFEDVDAAGTIVHKRTTGPAEFVQQDSQLGRTLSRTASKKSAAGKLVRSHTTLETCKEDEPMSRTRTSTGHDVSAPTLTRHGARSVALGVTEDESTQEEEGTGDVTAPTLTRTGSTVIAHTADEESKGENKEDAKIEDKTGEKAVEKESKKDGENDKDEEEGGDKEDKPKEVYNGASTGASQSSDDALDLAGLLNVLDGVVDCPNRIVIMTTNHPEKLDPALIRPGRINVKLFLGYLELEEATSMIEFYFGGYLGKSLTPIERDSIRLAWEQVLIANMRLTPAQLEQLCAEYDDVESLIKGLRRLAKVSGKRQ